MLERTPQSPPPGQLDEIVRAIFKVRDDMKELLPLGLGNRVTPHPTFKGLKETDSSVFVETRRIKFDERALEQLKQELDYDAAYGLYEIDFAWSAVEALAKGVTCCEGLSILSLLRFMATPVFKRLHSVLTLGVVRYDNPFDHVFPYIQFKDDSVLIFDLWRNDKVNYLSLEDIERLQQADVKKNKLADKVYDVLDYAVFSSLNFLLTEEKEMLDVLTEDGSLKNNGAIINLIRNVRKRHEEARSSLRYLDVHGEMKRFIERRGEQPHYGAMSLSPTDLQICFKTLLQSSIKHSNSELAKKVIKVLDLDDVAVHANKVVIECLHKRPS